MSLQHLIRGSTFPLAYPTGVSGALQPGQTLDSVSQINNNLSVTRVGFLFDGALSNVITATGATGSNNMAYYEHGSFPITYTGATANFTGACNYTRSGRAVNLYFSPAPPGVTGTTSAIYALNSIPSRLTPPNVLESPTQVINNGAVVLGASALAPGASGTYSLAIYPNIQDGSVAVGFSGAMGWSGFSICYSQ